MSTAAPPPGYTDADLIARVLRSDDRNAYSELVRRHQSALRASLRKLTGNPELADDIAQETFILAWRKIASFRFEARFSTWLYRIAFNAWQSSLRRRQETPLDDGDVNVADMAVSSSESDHAGVRHDLSRAMKALNDAERAAILQCYYNDLSHEEAAFVLGIPLGTLKSNVLRAREKLRAVLSDYQSDCGAAA